MQTVRYNQLHTHTVLQQQVRIKSRWADEWTDVDYLYADRVVWAAAPEVGQAQLSYRYGHGMRPGERLLADIEPTGERFRYYVQIEIETEDLAGDGNNENLFWHGTWEAGGYAPDGVLRLKDEEGEIRQVISGRQIIVCAGLEMLLENQVITHSRGDSEYRQGYIDRALAFNARGIGNRTAAKDPQRNCYLFSNDPAVRSYWSTADVVEYLLAEHGPKDSANGNALIEVKLAADGRDILANFDAPVVPCHGFRLRAVLNQLISRQRLIGYHVDADPAAGSTIRVKPFTFTDEVVANEIFPEDPIPANPNVIRVALNREASAGVTVNKSSLSRFDQVRIQGARSRCCGSISTSDGTLEEGWRSADQVDYRLAASEDAGYPAAGEVEARQKINAVVRSSPKFADVYARFRIPWDWDLQVGDGEGGDKHPINPVVREGQVVAAPLYRPGLALLATLPLLEGKDYSDDNIANGTVTDNGENSIREMPVLVVFPQPDDATVYQRIEQFGTLANLESSIDADANNRWSATVEVRPGEDAFYLRVSGQPQHVIAASHFTPLADDADLPQVDFLDMIATIAIEADDYCEGVYPPQPADSDAARILFLQAGDGYRNDYVAPGTVVGIDGETGELIRTTGGLIRDDSPILRAVAKLAYQWYGRNRRSLNWSVGRVTSAVRIGDFVRSLVLIEQPEGGFDQLIQSVVTQITLDLPIADQTSPPPPVMEYTTDFGQFDALQLL